MTIISLYLRRVTASESKFLFLLFFSVAIFASSCSAIKSFAENPHRDITSQLKADADLSDIVDHLLLARKTASMTRALALQRADIDQDQAYEIQMALLERMLADGESLVGWKMGGTLAAKPGDTLDPIFGFMLASDEYNSGDTIPATRFCEDTTNVEAEVCFWINKDLPGPSISRKQVEGAVGGVGGASELISVRVRDAQGSRAASPELAIADGLSHGGFILPGKKVPLADAGFEEETGCVKINGNVIAVGHAKSMMGGKPLDAVVALANRLLKYGHHLRAGNVVIIGSMLESPPAGAGDRAEIVFSTYEDLSISLE